MQEKRINEEMKSFYFIKSMLSLVVAFAMVACSEEEELQSGRKKAEPVVCGVEAIDGALHFASAEAFFNASSTLVAMDEDDRVVWERSIGFTSLNTKLTSIAEQYEYSDTLVELYPEYFEMVEDVVTISVPQIYSYVADGDGAFFVGNDLHVVDEDGIAYKTNTAFDTINEGTSYELKSVSADRCSVITRSKEHGKYKCIFTASLYTLSISDNGRVSYQNVLECKIENREKKLFNKWREHHSLCGHGDLLFYSEIACVADVNRSVRYEKGFSYKTATWSNKALVTFRTSVNYGDVVYVKPKKPEFITFSGHATNEELGGDFLNVSYPEL